LLLQLDGVSEVSLMVDPSNPERNRGFGFIEFKNYHSASKSLNSMAEDGYLLSGLPVSLDWAQPISKPVCRPDFIPVVVILYPFRRMMIS
jgi:RNA recognition motif-containing protein